MSVSPDPIVADLASTDGLEITYDFHGLGIREVHIALYGSQAHHFRIRDERHGTGTVRVRFGDLCDAEILHLRDLSGHSPDLPVKVIHSSGYRPSPEPARPTSSSTVGYYLVAFLTTLDEGSTWKLNLSSVGTWTAGRGWDSGQPPAGLEAKLRQLSSTGAKVLVSFGGAVFRPGKSLSSSSVDALAQAVAFSFLGGTQAPSPEGPYARWKPVFADFHFDGLDLDLEQSAGPPGIDPSVWVSFAEALKKYAPGTVLTGAPQSPYLYNTGVASPFGVPFPGGSDDTCGHVSAPLTGDFLLSTANVGLFDALFVQFYNQGAAKEFPTEAHFDARFCQFVKLVGDASAATKIFVGVAAQGMGENGESPGVYDPAKIGNAIEGALRAAGGTQTSPWFGGVMGWQSKKVTDLVQSIVAVSGGRAALYGYQDGDPGW